jgi:hypothetical protein
LLAAVVLLGTVAGDCYAYTYRFINGSPYPISVTVRLYDGTARTAELAPNTAHSVTTDALLQDWEAKALLDNAWQQVLHLTCDFLPGNHTFSVRVTETAQPGGTVDRHWQAVSSGD